MITDEGYSKSKVAFAKATATEGGEGGIRTRDTLSGIHTFQACSFNHSDTSPKKAYKEMDKIVNPNAQGHLEGIEYKMSDERKFCVTNGDEWHSTVTMEKGRIGLQKFFNNFLYKSAKRLILGDFKVILNLKP